MCSEGSYFTVVLAADTVQSAHMYIFKRCFKECGFFTALPWMSRKLQVAVFELWGPLIAGSPIGAALQAFSCHAITTSQTTLCPSYCNMQIKHYCWLRNFCWSLCVFYLLEAVWTVMMPLSSSYGKRQSFGKHLWPGLMKSMLGGHIWPVSTIKSENAFISCNVTLKGHVENTESWGSFMTENTDQSLWCL